MHYADINAQTVDRWVQEGWEWGKPISHEVYVKALAGEWSVLLTPTVPVPKAWFGALRGKKVLGLAAGGGQQMPVFAALGAECTVLDYSQEQLNSEKRVAEREGYDIRIVRADMTQPLPFEDESFDLIFHPVSNCYVRDVQHVWRECARILKQGGRLLSGLDNGLNYAFDEEQTRLVRSLPFDPLSDETLLQQSLENGDGVQFSHTIDEQIGGQLKAGFVLRDIYGDIDPGSGLGKYNVPAFWATLSVKEFSHGLD